MDESGHKGLPQIADLPRELLDIIIDHLHSDKISLKACSLVCHAWLDSSRYHLFREIRLVPSRSNHLDCEDLLNVGITSSLNHVSHYIKVPNSHVLNTTEGGHAVVTNYGRPKTRKSDNSLNPRLQR